MEIELRLTPAQVRVLADALGELRLTMDTRGYTPWVGWDEASGSGIDDDVQGALTHEAGYRALVAATSDQLIRALIP